MKAFALAWIFTFGIAAHAEPAPLSAAAVKAFTCPFSASKARKAFDH